MINFTPLAFLDCFDLAASLRSRLTTEDFGTPENGARTIPIHFEISVGFRYHSMVRKWPEMRNTLSRIKRHGEEIVSQTQGYAVKLEFGEIKLELLDPGVCLPWLIDDSTHAEKYRRLHLPLRTSPSTMVYSGLESLCLPYGLLCQVNHRVRYSAANDGETPRVHLIMDVRRSGE